MAVMKLVRPGVVVSLLAACILWGCGRFNGRDRALLKVNATKMQRLANLYLAYQMKNAWQGPAGEGEFKEFIGSFNPAKLKRIGVDPTRIDDLFVNDRDGQPFRIRYSVPGSAMGSSAPVVFESAGVDGQRWIGFLDMQQREVGPGEYEKLWSDAADTVPPRREAK